MRRFWFAALLAFLLAPAAWAAGTLDYVGKFNADGKEFDIALFTENGEKVPIIGIASDKRMSVAFSPNEWPRFVDLWHRAQNQRGSNWVNIGSFQETGTDERALLTVVAGPGVQFTINGAKGTSFFVLPRDQYADFDRAVQAMTPRLQH